MLKQGDFIVYTRKDRAIGRGHRLPAKRRRDGLYERCGGEQMDNQPGSLSERCSVNTNSAQVVWDSRVSATTHALWKLDCQLMNLAIRSLIIKARWIKSVVGRSSSSEVHTQWLRDALVVVKERNTARPGCTTPSCLYQ